LFGLQVLKEKIVIAPDKDFMPVRLLCKPGQEVNDFILSSPVTDISGMKQHITFRKAQAMVP
jgi:hypothetical protein